MTIRAENIGRVYGDVKGGAVTALADVSMRVAGGECVVILGPSGSGKSTLLNMLGGLAVPTAGRVLLDDIDVYALSKSRRAKLRRETIGFVFQSFHLVPFLTAEENVRVSLALRCGSRAATSAAARGLLDRVGLAARARHLPDQLSVGERQRVALARAVAGSPGIILADEPTGNLDPQSAASVSHYLRQFRDEGTAVIVVTHDDRLTAIADRTLALQAGRCSARVGSV